ncbi:TNF receptor-associated factor 2-like [Huso huso]|uniref:TNF receptor-associated factor 2-like n=1 Tax=Huso huso TaxID=61971 RepID=A0ABR0YEK8_HUSHU
MSNKINGHEGKHIKKRQSCTFEKLGCRFKGARSKAHKHEATSITLHMNLLLEEVLRLEKTEEARGEVLEKLNRLAERAEKQPGVNLDMQEEASCPDLNEKLQELCHTVQLLQIRVPGLESKTGELQNKVAVTSTAMEKCDALAKSMERELESNKRTINALQDKVRQLEQNISLCFPMNDPPVEVAQNGIFIWSIAQFRSLRQAAISGLRPYLESEAFYTSQYGYKMKLRIYLNGNEQAKGTHISLYFTLQTGDFDSLLKWPFAETVRLSILSQTNREDSAVHCLSPSGLLQGLQKPRANGNIPYGVPMFVSLTEFYSRLWEFVNDDTLFVKTEVEHRKV